MKKYISLLLSITLILFAIFSFTACSKRNRSEEEKVEKVLFNFMDEYEEMELANMAEYTQVPAKFNAEFKGDNLSEIMQLYVDEQVPQFDELIETAKDENEKHLHTQRKEVFINGQEILAAEIIEKCDYAMRDIKKSDKGYICIVEVRTTDIDDLKEKLAEIDEEKIMEEVIAEVDADETVTVTGAVRELLCQTMAEQRMMELKIAAYREADEDWESVELEFTEIADTWVVSDASELVQIINRKIISLIQ